MQVLTDGRRMTRRESIKKAAGAFMILPSGLARGYAANQRLDLGIIGLSGQGQRDAQELLKQGENIAAICDVDSTRHWKTFNRAPTSSWLDLTATRRGRTKIQV